MRLGSGVCKVFIADQGGEALVGELTGITRCSWERVRDDISSATVVMRNPSRACCELMAAARTVRNEVVIFRDGQRVWEGPITRIEYRRDAITVDARDVMWYASRRVLEQGVFRKGNPTNAVNLLYNLLIAHYPLTGDRFNVGPYVTKVNSTEDVTTAAEIPAYSRTVQEVLDKYADDGGVDYTVVGRRTLIYDTHLRGHVLPLLTDNDFLVPLTVTEYGSELATRTFVTNNDGAVTQKTGPTEWLDYYGPVDYVQSNLDEADGDPDEASQAALEDIAERELVNRYPAPVRVYASENSPLSCDAPVSLDALIPGAWAPLQALYTCRQVSAWEKLTRVSVRYEGGAEEVAVTFVQIPASRADPL